MVYLTSEVLVVCLLNERDDAAWGGRGAAVVLAWNNLSASLARARKWPGGDGPGLPKAPDVACYVAWETAVCALGVGVRYLVWRDRGEGATYLVRE